MSEKQLMTVAEFTAIRETLPYTYENPQGVEIKDLCCHRAGGCIDQGYES